MMKNQINNVQAAPTDWKLMSSTMYDQQNRMVSNTFYDYLSDGSTCLEATTTCGYDNWGYQNTVTDPWGVTQYTNTDPVARTQTSGIRNADGHTLSEEVITFDDFSQLSTLSRIETAGGQALITLNRASDAFGRTTSLTTTDNTVNLRIDQYDAFGRFTEGQLNDGTPLCVGYLDFSDQDQMTSMKINNELLSSQTFDGLLRRTSLTLEGVNHGYQRKMAYTSSARSAYPSQISTTSSTQQVDITYIPELGMLNSIHCHNNPATYTATYSSLGKMETSSPDSTYSLNGLGEPDQMSNEGLTTQVISLTLSGRVLSSLTGSDRMLSSVYDMKGRLLSSSDGDTKVSYSYDSFGRISGATFSQNGTPHLIYAFTRDNFSRETRRVLTDKLNGTTITIDSGYDVFDRRVSKKTTLSSGKTLSEAYSYDKRGRLTSYVIDSASSPDLLPVDYAGRPFLSQEDSWDERDRLKTSIIHYPDGSAETQTWSFSGQMLYRVQVNGKNVIEWDSATFSENSAGTLGYKNVTTGEAWYIESDDLDRCYRSPDGHTWQYDAQNNLIRDGEGDRCFLNGTPIREDNTSRGCVEFIYSQLGVTGERDDNGEVSFSYLDPMGSVIGGTRQTTLLTYSPQGTGKPATRHGFRGMLYDSYTQGYTLKNGRVYQPWLRVFSTVDATMGLNGGGVNGTTYCCGDPVNNADFSGAFSVGSFFSNLIGVVGAVAGIVMAIPTGGASLTMTAGAEILLGAGELAATATSIGLSAAGNEKGAKIAGGVAGILGLGSAGVGLGRSALPSAARTSGTPGGGGLRGPAKYYQNRPFWKLPKRKTIVQGSVPAAREGTRTPQWHEVAGGGSSVVLGSDQAINYVHIYEPLKRLERRASFINGYPRPVVILSGTHGRASGDNWELNGNRVATLIDKTFYNEDIQFHSNPGSSAGSANGLKRRVDIFDTDGANDKQYNQYYQDPLCHVIGGYCFSRNDEALRYYLNVPPVTSYVPDRWFNRVGYIHNPTGQNPTVVHGK